MEKNQQAENGMKENSLMGTKEQGETGKEGVKLEILKLGDC